MGEQYFTPSKPVYSLLVAMTVSEYTVLRENRNTQALS